MTRPGFPGKCYCENGNLMQIGSFEASTRVGLAKRKLADPSRYAEHQVLPPAALSDYIS